MSASRIHFHDLHMDAHDAMMQLWLNLLVREIDGLPEIPEWLREAREDWHINATEDLGFGVVPDLDGFITDEGRRHVVLDICTRALSTLHQLPDPVPAGALNTMGGGCAGSVFERDLPLMNLLEPAGNFVTMGRDADLRAMSQGSDGAQDHPTGARSM